MSISIVKVCGDYNSPQYKEFIIDSASDIELLPGLEDCAPGSVAMLANGTKMLLSPAGTWSITSSGSSTSSGGSTITVVSGKPTTIYSGEITVSSVDTSGSPILEVPFELPDGKTYGALYAIIEDKNGARSGYFYKSETAMVISEGSATASARGVFCKTGSGDYYSYGGGSIAYGIFVSSLSRTNNTFKIYARYNSLASSTINGTYKVNVYAVHDMR